MGISQEKQKAQRKLAKLHPEAKFPTRLASLAMKAVRENRDMEEVIREDKLKMIRKNYSTLQCEDCGVTISANKQYCRRCKDKRENLVQPYGMGDIK